MIREGWILADLLVGDPIQGGRVCKSDVNDLTPVGNPKGRIVTMLHQYKSAATRNSTRNCSL